MYSCGIRTLGAGRERYANHAGTARGNAAAAVHLPPELVPTFPYGEAAQVQGRATGIGDGYVLLRIAANRDRAESNRGGADGDMRTGILPCLLRYRKGLTGDGQSACACTAGVGGDRVVDRPVARAAQRFVVASYRT